MSELLIDNAGGVRTLKLNRPERLNAVNDALASQLIAALHEASADDSVRVIVITGEGRGFCSGLDLTTVANRKVETRHDALDDMAWVGRLTMAIVGNDKPVIAAINGVAAGAGFAMTLSCDLRFMAASARVTTGYIRRALSPDAGLTYFLPRIVGQTKANELIFTGRDVSAEEALRMGLVNDVFPDDAFAERVAAFAAQLAEGPPIAITLTKRLLAASPETDLLAQLRRELSSIRQCFGTEDVREGVMSMMEKRKPKFQGR
ncbi:enoyl-CoA hydratase/isomerase family protein [Alicyclobacillus cycloheptanicus]|jgi:2-(1,2-epoxy-1,2-dihydrophenyl)acetyl-CoA isomerase|uniref:2-(1,2-epoxy-1,2-dihydrophenyl)acetyl-CoA isomerase n=1 Tax=Alicyclobacillus cycloheptanicus TaxID=1457 RepID=A0ABT9XHB9_9BACL|nr:enoyl-CoA hydratase-related protein [Alicyclobacillus cycloheptanicus]MDQ0189696.1 2-(1,2-epoxy-1,2-dihydrophenyl)acetyl-CoA isomerase [Alicyclobacillus cycloheptanicus]WDM01908.1 enoyl-CoA hydratase/isomerase family protein [Alicyclobacillus cycloheptanicus]